MIYKKISLLLVLIILSGCGSQKIDPLVVTTTAQKDEARVLAAQVSEDRLRSYVRDMFNTRRYEGDERGRARASIEAEVVGLNYALVTQEFSSSSYEGNNIILTKPGNTLPNEWIVVLAHYDTVYSASGADDNGSSCAALLEIARLLSDQTFARTIKLVFPDQEELGMLGSEYFVSLIPAEVNIAAAISLDMVGYTSATQQNPFPAPFEVNTGDFLSVIGEGDSITLANDFVRNLKQGGLSLPTVIINPHDVVNNLLLQDLLRSDHAYFWVAGWPAIMISDTANFRNPNYHELTDTADTLDFDFLKKCTQATLINAYLWAEPE